MYVIPLLTLVRGAFCCPLLMFMSEGFSVPFLTLIILCYERALEGSSLVLGSEVKSSSSETLNLALSILSF